jgi:acetylornithine/succinyldiaminopimelate/putrescine aminotransferase
LVLLRTVIKILYDDIEALENNIFKFLYHQYCGVLVEPIQGEAGLPSEVIWLKAKALCKQHNVFIHR